MAPEVIAALVAAQTPEHAACRAQEFVEVDPSNPRIVRVKCSCNVGLSLVVGASGGGPVTVNVTVEPGGDVEAGRAVAKALAASAPKEGSDGA